VYKILSHAKAQYDRQPQIKRDNISIVVVRPRCARKWSIRFAPTTEALEKVTTGKPVAIRAFPGSPSALDKPHFLIENKIRRVLSYGGIHKTNKMKLNFEDGEMWFSCEASGKSFTGPKSCNPDCAEMLRFALQIFPALGTNGKMENDLQKLNTSSSYPSRGHRRLAPRQPVNYYNHFPPFVRTCQEILNALDDAGVEY